MENREGKSKFVFSILRSPLNSPFPPPRPYIFICTAVNRCRDTHLHGDDTHRGEHHTDTYSHTLAPNLERNTGTHKHPQDTAVPIHTHSYIYTGPQVTQIHTHILVCACTHTHTYPRVTGIQTHKCSHTHVHIPTEATGAQFSGEGEACFPVYSGVFSSTQLMTLDCWGQQTHLVIETPFAIHSYKTDSERTSKGSTVYYPTLYTFIFDSR